MRGQGCLILRNHASWLKKCQGRPAHNRPSLTALTGEGNERRHPGLTHPSRLWDGLTARFRGQGLGSVNFYEAATESQHKD